MLTRTAEYALRAVLYLAEAPEGTRTHVGAVAAALDAPQNYLSKVLNSLVREGILSSARGPHGGFALARSSESLTLAEIIEPFDPVEDRCLLMRRRCSDVTPCIAHYQWKEVAMGIRAFFRQTTVADLLDGASHPGLPLLQSEAR